MKKIKKKITPWRRRTLNNGIWRNHCESTDLDPLLHFGRPSPNLQTLYIYMNCFKYIIPIHIYVYKRFSVLNLSRIVILTTRIGMRMMFLEFFESANDPFELDAHNVVYIEFSRNWDLHLSLNQDMQRFLPPIWNR